MRARIGAAVAEAQHVHGSAALGHRGDVRGEIAPLVGIEGVEQPAVQHGVKPATQTAQLERVSHRELGLEVTLFGLLAGDRQCGLGHVNAQHRQPQRGDVQRVLAGPAARIEHRADEPAGGRQAHDGRLWVADVPGGGAVVV